MDFFQAQDAARRKSKLLVFYFAAAVVAIVAVIYAVVIGVVLQTDPGPEYEPAAWWRPDVFAVVALTTIAVILLGSLFKTLALRSGGGTVARSLGGTVVAPDTTDLKQRRLLNVVEEMAIASGVRIPEVYLLPEPGINAFAAGWSPDDAAVAVTQGALDTLTRDELQGVIAHEFSHILNGDMRLNLRLIGLLFGILLLAIIGRGLFQSMRFARLSSGRNKNSGGIVVAIVLLGLTLIIVGYVGVLFGRLIQAAVSRQREFLADASAVQFTRNPDGIAGALKRIGGLAAGSRVANIHAAETSHLFFANAMSGSALDLFATHPPLVARIRAIDPQFDGAFKPVTPPPLEGREAPEQARPSRGAAPPPLPPQHFVENISRLAVAGAAETAGHVFADIPPGLREAAHDPARARAVVLMLLVSSSDDPAEAARQRTALTAALPPGERAALQELQATATRLPASARLPLVDLALPTIRRLPPEEIDAFLQAMQSLIAADERTTLFEFALSVVVNRYLRPPAWTGDRPGAQVFSYQPLADAVSLVLSTIARAGSGDPAAIQRSFTAGASQLGLIRNRLALKPADALQAQNLRQALANLERAAPPIKQNVLGALARAAAADGVIMPGEQEILRAVAAAIDCPAPPMAVGGRSD